MKRIEVGITGRIALVFLAALICLSGCGRGGSGRSEDSTAAVEVPETSLICILEKTIDSGLERLDAVKVGSSGKIYLAGQGGVKILNEAGELIGGWKTDEPVTCVYVEGEDNIYVGFRSKVARYDSKGKEIASWGVAGKERGQLGVVTCIDAHGSNVLVADAGNRCVHRFGLAGDFINDIGRRDEAAGVPGLICPSPHLDCIVDDPGNVHVNSPGRRRVEKYNLDGALLGSWGKQGMRPEQFCGCCNPTDIALLDDGKFVTSEKGIQRVKLYDSKGNMLAYIGPESFSVKISGMDLAVDSKGRIYVADPGDGKLRIFRWEKRSE